MSKKKTKRETRAEKALLVLVDLYIKTGKPVGSETLKESGFQDISSATLRNYFVDFEKEGFLIQPHISGGRIPTHKAFRFYAEHALHSQEMFDEDELRIDREIQGPTKHIASFLHSSAELLSELTHLPVFLSSVRFDNDFILDVKLVTLDAKRVLAILITHFGQVFTETLFVEKKLSTPILRRIEKYFHWKLSSQKGEAPLLSEEEKSYAMRFYNEFALRYLAFYTNFSDEDIFRTGFSKLLEYPEFSDPLSLSSTLSLFENMSMMRKLLTDSTLKNDFSFWIGPELATYGLATSGASVITIPFLLNHVPAGAFGVLGPLRIPYKRIFGILKSFSLHLSESLTKSLYRFKLSFRHPRSAILLDGKWNQKLLEVKS